jgi:hypothetical protein
MIFSDRIVLPWHRKSISNATISMPASRRSRKKASLRQQPGRPELALSEAWLRDPACNRLCLFFAGEKRRFPPWRINP